MGAGVLRAESFVEALTRVVLGEESFLRLDRGAANPMAALPIRPVGGVVEVHRPLCQEELAAGELHGDVLAVSHLVGDIDGESLAVSDLVLFGQWLS